MEDASVTTCRHDYGKDLDFHLGIDWALKVLNHKA